MKRDELESLLQKEGFDPTTRSFKLEAPPSEGYILDKIGERWIIYYTDRGYIRDIANFLYESDACDYFYKQLPRMQSKRNWAAVELFSYCVAQCMSEYLTESRTFPESINEHNGISGHSEARRL